MFRSAQHDRGIGFGLGDFSRRVRRAVECGPKLHSIEFKNDFAVAFALVGVCHCSLRVLQWISFVDFRLQQTAPGHFKQWLERFHAFGFRRVVVPFVDPDAAETEIFEDE